MALNQAKEKVRQLEHAIKKLDAIKRHLSHNASDIKVEIHSCVSHNLESLRGREVTLLGKVDELVALKEESLQQQQAKLNQALGVLQTRMAMMTSTDSILDQQLSEILAKFDEIDLSPGETPHIAFRADHMSLRECILNYGRVDSNALPFPSAFDDPGKPSASLPRHLEEYEDEDHHIFYKTVEELKQNNSATKSITVTIPKLSTRMEDWLQKQQTPTIETSSSPARPTTLPNQVSSGVMSHCSTPGDTCSLNNWLSQIKNHADLEEEHNFEIVDNSVSKKVKLTNKRSVAEDLKPWLHKSSESLESLLTAQSQSLNLFHHIPSDSKFWLRQYHEQAVTEDKTKQDMFQHISKEPSTWLKTRAYGKQTPQRHNEGSAKEKLGDSKDRDIDQWLSQVSRESLVIATGNGNNNNNCCKQGGGRHQTGSTSSQEKISTTPFQLEDICKANELCSTLMECVCSPNCATQRQHDVSGVKNPVDPTKVFNPPQLPLSQWLISDRGSKKMDLDSDFEEIDGEKNGLQDPIGKGIFSHIPKASSDVWLFKPVSQSSDCNVLNPTFKHCKEETNLWLQQANESSCLETNAKVLLNFNPSNRSLSEWLMTPPARLEVAVKGEEDVDMLKEESEGWSLCSSPATFSSEQFSKDVKVAANYMQDWVL